MKDHKPLSVLYWFRRRPYARGGDWVGLQATLDALRAFNVQATVSDDPTIDLARYDLIHLYNLCDPYSASDYVLRAVRARKPLVATPLYWSHAQYLAAIENESPETYPELFLTAPTPEARARLRAARRREAELLHDAQQLVFGAAQKVLVLSNGEGSILQEEFGMAPEKLHLTYNGVDPKYQRGDADYFAREFRVRDFVLSAARFEHRKNQVGLIRAWRDESVPLVLAGAVPEPEYFALCRQEATPNIHFVGDLAPAQIADAGAAARVHVLPSWWEEVGLAALEAGLAGCTLVMTQNGPGREYFGDDCLTCDPANPASIREAVHAALARPRAADLAQRILTQFSWERAATATREAYDEALACPLLANIDLDLLSALTIQLAEELHRQERQLTDAVHAHQELERWALDMQSRLRLPPTLGSVVRGWLKSEQP